MECLLPIGQGVVGGCLDCLCLGCVGVHGDVGVEDVLVDMVGCLRVVLLPVGCWVWVALGWVVLFGGSMGCCHGMLCSCFWIGFLLRHGVVMEVRCVSVRVTVV